MSSQSKIQSSKSRIAVGSSIQITAAAHESPVVDVITLAFSTDPVARWTWPDSQSYLAYFPSFIEAFGGKAFSSGSAYCADSYAGAALWLPPDSHADDDKLINLLQRTVAEPLQADLFAVFEAMENYHPSEPHWYLPLLGVDPFQQSKGYGSALMQHALIQCDRDKTSAYLESTNERSIPFYEKQGFKVLGTIQIGSSPRLFPMIRSPR